MIKKRFISMLVLLAAVVTGAWAQSYEVKVFDLPASWASDETYISAADLPEDFVQITKDEAAALAVPDGIVVLIYGFNGDNAKEMMFSNGIFVNEAEGQEKRKNIIGYQTDFNAKICYTAAAAATYTVSLKEGTEDATSWKGKAGEGEYQDLPLTGLEAGTAVTVKYNGTKKVKSVKAATALNLTSPAVGQVIGDDGKNYDYTSLPDGVTAVAKICYVSGSNGLALALADETGTMNWSTAKTTCAAHTPAFTGGTWKLATYDEWNDMIVTAGSNIWLSEGFSSVGGSNLQSGYYWSSTEDEPEPSKAYCFNFGNGSWFEIANKDNDLMVRACLAFRVQDPIELTSTDGETWTLASMPDYDVELEVEYETAPATYTVTAKLANGAYWATFYTEAGNYQAPEGTQVFAVTLTGTAIEMTVIPNRIALSGKGVVLKNTTTGSITMTKTETAPDVDYSGSSLTGTMTSITNPSYGNIYVLNNDTYGVGFYKLQSDGTIGANKAYLTTAAGAREFFLFDEATGIEMPTVEDNADAVVYDLQGRRVAQPTKGLYIVNGKKVIK